MLPWTNNTFKNKSQQNSHMQLQLTLSNSPRSDALQGGAVYNTPNPSPIAAFPVFSGSEQG